MISHFFRKENTEFAHEVYNQILECEKSIGKEVLIINSYSSLRLFEYVFQNQETNETKDPVTFERDIFQVYLLINKSQIEGELIASDSTKHLPFELKVPMTTMCHMFPYFDILNQDSRK